METPVLGNYLAWVGFGSGVSYEEIAIIALILISIGIQFLFARINARIIRESIVLLDQNLAEAIKETLENLAEAIKETLEDLPEAIKANFVDGIEPPNPIQEFIAQMMRERMGSAGGITEVAKAIDGKFEKQT